MYKYIDPLEGQIVLAHTFIIQTAADIRRKLQKLEAEAETPFTILVEEATQIFNNRDLEEEAKREKKKPGRMRE